MVVVAALRSREVRYAWVEVSYGDDRLYVGIVDDEDAEMRAMDDYEPHPAFGSDVRLPEVCVHCGR